MNQAFNCKIHICSSLLVFGTFSSNFFLTKIQYLAHSRTFFLCGIRQPDIVILNYFYQVVPGELTIVTGVPNSGKSEWIDALLCNLNEFAGWKFALCSMENKVRLFISDFLCSGYLLLTFR